MQRHLANMVFIVAMMAVSCAARALSLGASTPLLSRTATCPEVDSLVVTHTTTDSIGIAWTPVGSEAQWLVSDGTNEYVVNNAAYTFGGLRSGRVYTLSVRAICDATGDTSGAVTITAQTLCGAISVLPFIENFDSYVGNTTNASPTNNLPLCWDYINHGGRNNYKGYPIVYNNYARSEGNCIRFYAFYNAADSTHYAILPPTDSILFPVNTLKVSFYMRASNAGSTYKAEAIVGVITDPLDGRTFVPFDTVYANGMTTYSRYEVAFDSYNGNHARIALKFPSPAGSGFNYNSGYIDDIVVEEIPDCMPVINLMATNVSDSTVDLTWTDTVGHSSWRVEYGASGFIRGTGTVVNVADTHALLTGLTVNTAYDVYVAPNCSGGVAGLAFITCRTACGTINVLPYFEDFEGYNIGSANVTPPDCGIPCWHRLDNATQYHFGYIGNPSTWIYGARSGTGFLYYYFPPTTAAYPDWVISVLPPVNTALYPVNTLRMSFWVKMNEVSSCGDIEVGVMTDPTNDSTFVPVDTVSVCGILYGLKEVEFDRYTGTGAYIAMRLFRNPASIDYYFIDDITVERMPSCQPVENITLIGSDSTSLSVSWVEVGTATSWTMEYGVSGFTPGSGTGIVVRSLPYTISGLTPSTAYDIYVRPICTSGSTLTRTATFRTRNSYLLPPLVCDFEDTALNACWSLENGINHNKWCIGNATAVGEGHSLYVSNNGGNSYAYTVDIADAVDYAFVDVMLSNPGDYGYTFDWKCEGENLSDYLRVALIPVSESLTASTVMTNGLTVASMPLSWIPLDGGCRINQHATWQSRSDVAEIAEPGAYHLAFIFRCNNQNGTQPPPAIDNITLSYNPCTRPDSVVLSGITQTEAHFTWREVGTANEWQYQLDSGAITTVYTAAVAFTSLDPNSPHTFRVRSVCGNGDTSYWRVYQFHTPCGYVSLPYTQDFESDTAGSSTSHAFAQCWTHLNNGIAYFGYPYINTNGIYNHTVGGHNWLNWYNSITPGTYGDYQAIVLPPFDTTISADSLQLSFWTRSGSSEYSPELIVGVMTDPDNIATFVGVDTVTINGAYWREVSVPLSTYTGEGRFVAMKAERPLNYWYAYIDDITLDYITTCFVPTMVYATNTTASSITLDWVDISPVMQWQVEYGPHGYTQGSADGTLLTTTAHPVVISGLDYLTEYDFYIRPICGEDDSARWRFPTTLMTAMCDNSLVASTGYATSAGKTSCYPVNNFYKYTLTETIIDSAELGGEMDIMYISYYYDTTAAMTHKDNCTIYLQPTTLSSFESTSSVVALDTATAVMVYTGSLNCTQGWNYFLLDTVYHYDGNGNLLVIVDDNSGDFNSSSYVFKSHPCIGNKTLHYYSDTYNPDVLHPSSFAGSKFVDSSRVVMQLFSCLPPTCPVPVITDISQTYESVTLTWSGVGTYYEVNIKEADSTDWTVPDILVAGNTYTFTGLRAATNYTFRVRQDCNADSLGYSDWFVGDFMTDSLPCLPPDGVAVDAVTNSTVTLNWVPFGNETVWDIHVWTSGGADNIYTVSSHPATVSGFTANTSYNVSVRPLCGFAHNIVGDWSDTVNFTTAVCPDVTGLGTRNPTSSSVEIYWNDDPLAQSWILEYGFRGFDLGAGTQVITAFNSYIVTGLLDDMEYDFRVRAVCGDDWQSEGWASTSATTLPISISCEAPRSVYAEVLGNAASISWIPGEGNIAFELEYGTRGFAHGNGTVVSTTASPITLTGLDYGTDYDLYVRGICTQGAYSDWSTVVCFTTETVGIDDMTVPTCIINPNPTSGTATISVSGISGRVRISVVDMSGRELSVAVGGSHGTLGGEMPDCSNGCVMTMDVDNLAQGAYFVRIIGENVSLVKKLIVR